MAAETARQGGRAVELLAPAGNLDIGLAAVNHGADAVYIGAPRFGARAAAANSVRDIEHLATYAHRFRARVYVALNTLLDDSEVDAAVALAHRLYEAGADALIIQDMGLLECDLPPVPLHASTQCDNRSPEKVRFLEDVGFAQVVLARELGLEQIRAICRHTKIVVECFVHGALCVSYSGQCYISEAVAGRSANRGTCAQFCRHRYTLSDRRGTIVERDRYLLSLQDLDLMTHLAALIEAGVGSLKIEGRLKDSNYVKNVTAAYRLALDRILAADPDHKASSSGCCRYDFVPDTARTFNRGKTSYFLVDRRSRPGSIRTPKAIGQRIGTVVETGAREFLVDTDETLANGDGLCFVDRSGELHGVKVNRVAGNRVFTRFETAVRAGDVLFRNHDARFVRQLEASGACRKIRVEVDVIESGTHLRFLLSDEDGIVSSTDMPINGEKARQPEKIREMIGRQAVKTGETIYEVVSCGLDCPHGWYVSVAELNRLRRLAFDTHDQARQRLRVRPVAVREPNSVPWLRREATFRDNITNTRAEAFYRRHGVEQFSGLGPARRPQMCTSLMTTRYCLRNQLGICPRERARGTGDAEPLILTDNTGSYELVFDCGRCEMTVRLPPAG